MTGGERRYKPGKLGTLYKENSFYFKQQVLAKQ
jgi:hypothetical protein